MDEKDFPGQLQLEVDHLQTLVSDVMDKLATQGSADQIALFLEQQGIRGRQLGTSSCAVARYVQRESGIERVFVNDEAVIAKAVDAHAEVFHSSAEISRFVYGFDHGEYPNLLED